MHQPSLWSDPPERDLRKGERLKSDGMRIVLDNQGEKWATMAQHLMLLYIAEHGPCLMEDARTFSIECGLPQPKHPNAWGAAVSGMSKRGDVEMIGSWAKSQSVKSHARIQPMWRAVSAARNSP